MMLFIHLSTLAALYLLPGEGGGVAFKKVCLRKEFKANFNAAKTNKLVLQHTKEAETPAKKPETKPCSVKILCTAATNYAVLTTPLLLHQEPPFPHQVYFYLLTFADPDPPRLG